MRAESPRPGRRRAGAERAAAADAKWVTWQRLGLSLLVVVTYVLGLGLGVPALVAAPLQAGGLLVLAIVAVLAMLWIWREG